MDRCRGNMIQWEVRCNKHKVTDKVVHARLESLINKHTEINWTNRHCLSHGLCLLSHIFLASVLKHPALPGQITHTHTHQHTNTHLPHHWCVEKHRRAEETWASAVVTGSTLVRSILLSLWGARRRREEGGGRRRTEAEKDGESGAILQQKARVDRLTPVLPTGNERYWYKSVQEVIC